MDYKKLLKNLNIKDYEKIGQSLQDNLPKYGIVEDEDAFRFLANTLNESGGFTVFKENLYYTTEVRLAKVFKSAFGTIIYNNALFKKDYPTYFDKDTNKYCQIHNYKYNPTEYLKNPVKLANLVYDDRLFPKKGLGNIYDGDGSKFIGRGAVQITGRYNYTKLSKNTGIDFVNKPELLETPEYALISAMDFWRSSGISKKKSLLESRQVVAGNYTNKPFGLEEVQGWYNRIKKSI